MLIPNFCKVFLKIPAIYIYFKNNFILYNENNNRPFRFEKKKEFACILKIATKKNI